MKNFIFSFIITLVFCQSIFAGNTCEEATPIPIFLETCVPDLFVGFSATPSNMESSCATNTNPDWYLEFIADNIQATIEFGDLIFGAGSLVVYEECGAEIYCESLLLPFSSHELTNLTAGLTYQIRIVMPPGIPSEGFICVHSPDCMPQEWYADNDNDTYGDPNDVLIDCFQPTGYVLDNTDCDDTDPDVNPGATEVCNGIDDDCDSLVDDDDPSVSGQLTWYADFDNDTYGDPNNSVLSCDEPAGANFVLDNTDCDDTNPDVNPGATEICNGIDDDCDSLIDDQDPDVVGQTTWYADDDGDDYGDPDFSVDACIPPNDDWVTDNTDCDDTNPNIHPGATEICNGMDDNCDDLIDDDDPDVVGQLTWYADFDFDTYGDPLVPVLSCTQPTGYVEDFNDCDDSNPDINPGATEICNGFDDNCNDLTDDDDPDVVGQTTWYADFDFDTYGDPLISVRSCDQPPDYVEDFSDCDDNNPDINPGATEICNGFDDDCDDQVDEDGITDVTITSSGLTLTAVVTGGTPPYSYLWSTGDTTETITVEPPVDTIKLTVSDLLNCVETVTYILTDIETTDSFVIGIYPMPVRNILHLNFPEDIGHLDFVEITNTNGKRILSKQNVNPSAIERIDLSNEDPGYYIIHLINDGRFQILKFILLKE